MDAPKQKNDTEQNDKDQKILQLEKEVAIGLWIQVIGQFIEIKGLSGLLHLEDDSNTIGEQQILTGAWIRTIGQLLEAISVQSQINETDKLKLIQEQKMAITGDFLVSVGAAYEVIGGLRVLEEETVSPPRIVP
ncbi:hypothetical protein [Neobacillus cucumis]|uniref:Uncharacterized protein n=1 Tax=Neobacillus cucumis TaxID=1740721 RepID=A0A2N5HSK1_9BACI|nr:hypothetical protein [Neobacillus cucumis]PLS08499.1 hypothetical protein CVD27_03605 [Neobacillus cucumis]